VSGWMDVWIGEWMDGWVGGCVSGWVDGCNLKPYKVLRLT